MASNTIYTSHSPVDDFGLPFSKIIYNATLAATTDTSFTVPGDSPRYKAVITCSTLTPVTVYMALNATAAAPAGASFAKANSEILPETLKVCREVRGGDVIHFFSSVSGVSISVVLYSIDICDHT